MNTNKETIDVIIPYNRELRIIDSILNQHNPENHHLYFIFVENNLKNKIDRREQEMEEAGIGYKFITCKKGGAGSARNMGIKEGNGKYIMFLDSDDELEKDYFSSFSREIRKDFRYFLNSSVEIRRLGVLDSSRYIRCVGESSYWRDTFGSQSWGKLFYRDIIEKNEIRFFDGMFEDVVFLHEYLLHIGPEVEICPVNTTYIWHVGAPGQITTEYVKNLKPAMDNLDKFLELFNREKEMVLISNVPKIKTKIKEKYTRLVRRVLNDIRKDSTAIHYIARRINPEFFLEVSSNDNYDDYLFY